MMPAVIEAGRTHASRDMTKGPRQAQLPTLLLTTDDIAGMRRPRRPRNAARGQSARRKAEGGRRKAERKCWQSLSSFLTTSGINDMFVPERRIVMATMNVSLPDPMKSWVEARLKYGSFNNTQRLSIRHLIRRDEERAQAIEALQQAIDEVSRAATPSRSTLKRSRSDAESKPSSSLTAYRLTPAAQRDLEDIWLYTAQTWSMAQADRYSDIMEDTFDRLLFMPEMARERSEFDPPVRIHPSAEHLIIYRVRARSVGYLTSAGRRAGFGTRS